ncbi:MAG: hypothetical protein LBE22_04940, partial [Azoarcus sp.]|nr:hypothetical protein [Azoarcus sp.]
MILLIDAGNSRIKWRLVGENGSRAISAIYGGVKRDKATPGAEGSPKPYRGIPGLQDGVTQ